MNPTSFQWGKSFLGSKAWNIILKDKNIETTITFSLPLKCPNQDRPHCSSQAEITHTENEPDAESTLTKLPIPPQSFASTSALHLKRKNSKAPMVVSEVRRSGRLKGKSNGFKSASCPSRNCLCCTAEPLLYQQRS
jgi:hypothetical protein